MELTDALVKDISKLTHDNVVAFIAESNRIESYDFPVAAYKDLASQVDCKEIMGHMNAAHIVLQRVGEPMTVEFIQLLHAVCMKDLMEEVRLEGAWRDFNVTVGGKPAGSDHEEVPMDMAAFVNCYNMGEEEAWNLHYFFECIHPFADGNGRTGRLLLMHYLLSHCGHTVETLPTTLSIYYEMLPAFKFGQQRYYKAITKFRWQKFERMKRKELMRLNGPRYAENIG